MTEPAVALEDILDVQAWTRWQVERFLSRGSAAAARGEHEDMHGQGVVILYELHERWDPAKCPKFSAFALAQMQLRLIDHFRRDLTASGRGHIEQKKGGKRGAVQYHGMLSLNAPEDVAVAFSQEPALTHYDPVEA